MNDQLFIKEPTAEQIIAHFTGQPCPHQNLSQVDEIISFKRNGENWQYDLTYLDINDFEIKFKKSDKSGKFQPAFFVERLGGYYYASKSEDVKDRNIYGSFDEVIQELMQEETNHDWAALSLQSYQIPIENAA